MSNFIAAIKELREESVEVFEKKLTDLMENTNEEEVKNSQGFATASLAAVDHVITGTLDLFQLHYEDLVTAEITQESSEEDDGGISNVTLTCVTDLVEQFHEAIAG